MKQCEWKTDPRSYRLKRHMENFQFSIVRIDTPASVASLISVLTTLSVKVEPRVERPAAARRGREPRDGRVRGAGLCARA